MDLRHLVTAGLSASAYKALPQSWPIIQSPIGNAAHKVTFLALPVLSYHAAGVLASHIIPDGNPLIVLLGRTSVQFLVGTLLYAIGLFALGITRQLATGIH